MIGECETERGWPRVCDNYGVLRYGGVGVARTACSAAASRNGCGVRGPMPQGRHPHDGPASGRAPSRLLALQRFCAPSPLPSSQLSVGSWRNGRPAIGRRPPPTRSAWLPGRPAALRVACGAVGACRRLWAWNGVASGGGVSSAPAACALGRNPTCPGGQGPPPSIAARGWNPAPTSAFRCLSPALSSVVAPHWGCKSLRAHLPSVPWRGLGCRRWVLVANAFL